MNSLLTMAVGVSVVGLTAASEKLGQFGRGVKNIGAAALEAAPNLAKLGERMTKFGERMSLNTALRSEGAERISEWLKSVSEPGMAMERSMSTLAAMTDLGGEALAKIREHAVAFSNTLPGETAEQADTRRVSGHGQNDGRG